MSVTSSAAASKAIRLNYSRPIDFHKTSTDPAIDSLVDNLFAQMQRAGLTSKRYAPELKTHIKVISLDLIGAYRTDPRRYLAYSRNRNDYSGKSKYKPRSISYTHTIKFIDFLKSQGYVEPHGGFHDQDDASKSRLPRIKATANFNRLCRSRKILLRMIDRDVNEETIILRDADKNEIDYTNTPDTDRMRENLRKINEVLDKHVILLDMKDDLWDRLYEDLRKDNRRQTVDFTRKKLFRIFNNENFQQGGRFYRAWWQGIPSGYRKYITINHKDTVELDYSGLHINMMYAIEKVTPPPGDRYALPGYGSDVRKFLKKSLQTFINATDRESAVKAVRKAINKKKIDPPDCIKSNTDIGDVFDAFEKKHTAISNYFCTGRGINLQVIDSQIAEAVMLHYAKQHRAVLPVHDSFIMITSMQDELKETMNEAFRRELNVDIKIKLEPTVRAEEKKESEQFRKERGITSPFVTEEEFRHYVDTQNISDNLYAEFSKPGPRPPNLPYAR